MKEIAYWDREICDSRLGNFFIFLHEVLACQPRLEKVVLNKFDSHRNSYLREMLLKYVPQITVEYQNSPLSTIEITQWLGQVDHKKMSYSGSMQWLQEIYSGRSIPSLAGARNTPIHCQRKVVAVHLKNNPIDPQSNANQRNWQKVFEKCHLLFSDTDFMLIGDDLYSQEILNLPNVNFNNSAVQDYFSQVINAHAFVGMSSAFCNAAILSDTPYCIWKHPDHHASEMEKELSSEGKFSFQQKNQYFIRSYDTYDSILKHLTLLIEKL